MPDLTIGFAVIAVLACGLFWCAAGLAAGLSVRAGNALGLLAVGCLLLYICLLWQSPQVAAWLPYSNLIVVGNWLPLFTAAIAGLVWQRLPASAVRRGFTLAALVLCGAFASIYPLLGPVPRCQNRWDKLGTCLQTTDYTCSPAAAATLLHKYGIEASEQEMARLCLTRRGTTWQGLYRGLKLKTAGTPWDVQVCHGLAEDLALPQGGPMIVSVGLAANAAGNTDFSREFGWVPGVNHSVVLERVRANGVAIVADPSQEMSREHWDRETLRKLWRGNALRLVPREP
ncbi:MAG: hypothetical protein WD872_00905 [Pirellulaceae bacterium]